MLCDMPMVFLSYRRDDSRADTGRLYDHLSRAFGDQNVFMDVDDISPGDNFVSALETTLGRCDVLVAVIGPRWVTAAGADGQPRLADPSDFLHIEISTALARRITLIPVLVGGAQMPASEHLPPPLAALASQQAVSVRHERFRDDVQHLVSAIRRKTRGAARRRLLTGWAAAVTVALLLVAGAGTWWALTAENAASLRAAPAVISVPQAKAMLAERDFFTARSNAAGKGGRHDYRTRVIGEHVVIVDTVSGLMWQKDAFSPQRTFEAARTTLDEANASGWAGFRDWRLPTLEEAASLITPEQAQGYFIDPVFETGAAPAMWTADTTPGGRRWVVWFSDASVVPESAGFNAWLRLVRSNP